METTLKIKAWTLNVISIASLSYLFGSIINILSRVKDVKINPTLGLAVICSCFFAIPCVLSLLSGIFTLLWTKKDTFCRGTVATVFSALTAICTGSLLYILLPAENTATGLIFPVVTVISLVLSLGNLVHLATAYCVPKEDGRGKYVVVADIVILLLVFFLYIPMYF